MISSRLACANQAARLLRPRRRNQPVSFSCLLRWMLDRARDRSMDAGPWDDSGRKTNLPDVTN
jgi:hypothetical protein